MRAVDMPINQSVEETLEKVRAIVKQNQYKKIILMVDIGSWFTLVMLSVKRFKWKCC